LRDAGKKEEGGPNPGEKKKNKCLVISKVESEEGIWGKYLSRVEAGTGLR